MKTKILLILCMIVFTLGCESKKKKSVTIKLLESLAMVKFWYTWQGVHTCTSRNYRYVPLEINTSVASYKFVHYRVSNVVNGSKIKLTYTGTDPIAEIVGGPYFCDFLDFERGSYSFCKNDSGSISVSLKNFEKICIIDYSLFPAIPNSLIISIGGYQTESSEVSYILEVMN